jgi:hypothetical protein
LWSLGALHQKELVLMNYDDLHDLVEKILRSPDYTDVIMIANKPEAFGDLVDDMSNSIMLTFGL